MLSSQLFAGDPLLEAIAADGPQRISTFQNQNDPAVAKVQQALLLWRPDVLPVHGTDGHYGSETAAAVTSFKIDELAVPPEQVIADVGPQTVRRLDEIALAAEQPPIPPEPTTFVRQDVYQLQPPGAPVHPIIAAYAVAVRELKRNNGPQHRLWSHHTQVHGMNPDPGDGLRNQCQHFCWYFLPWHRMYLHAFEAICRSIIVESAEVDDETKATWALPYWDYDRADSAELPPAFRNPVLNGAPNPLFEQARDLGINSPVQFRGEPAPRLARLVPEQTGARGWFTNSPFSNPFVPAFAGTETGFNHAGAPNAIPGPLEISPHGSVHVFVGGRFGKMSDFDQAAGDPIFWLHHANLDRLWEVWRGSTGLGLDPRSSRFNDQTFEFLDASGQRIQPSCGSVLNLANLGYGYTDTSIPASAGAGGPMDDPNRGPQRPRERNRPPRRVGAVDEPVRLQGDATRVEFPTDAPATRGDERFLVSVEHIRADDLPNAEWGVYLEPTSGEAVLVGTLPLFGMRESLQGNSDHDLSYLFDITDLVQRLDAEGRWDAERFRATLAPVNAVPVEAEPDPEVVIGTIALLIQ